MLAAAQSGDVGTVRYYLGQGIDPNYQHPEMGTTALHEAALYGHLPVVQLLVENGAALDIIREFGGGTPQEVAEQHGQCEVAVWLNTHQPAKPGFWARLFGSK